MSALRQFETAGVNLSFPEISPELLNGAKQPFFLPLRLSVEELAGLVLLPCTSAELAGVDGLHPKLIRSPAWLNNSGHNDCRCFAESLDANPTNLKFPVERRC